MAITPRPRARVLSGGVAHDFPATSARLVELLAELDIDAEVREDVLCALDDLDQVDLLVVNMLRWRMASGRYADRATEFGISVPPALQHRVEEWVHAGRGGLLALHAASICFDDWAGWRDLVGARWDWNTSRHPPLGPVEVKVHPDRHPVVAGLPTRFEIHDEVYGFLDQPAGIRPLATAPHTGREHPLLWALDRGAGRVVHDTLGHHVASYEVDAHRRIVQRSALWLLGRSDAEVASR